MSKDAAYPVCNKADPRVTTVSVNSPEIKTLESGIDESMVMTNTDQALPMSLFVHETQMSCSGGDGEEWRNASASSSTEGGEMPIQYGEFRIPSVRSHADMSVWKALTSLSRTGLCLLMAMKTSVPPGTDFCRRWSSR